MRLARKFEIVASDYGRIGGWIAEFNSEPVAELEDARFEDMFWDTYRIQRIGDTAHALENDEFWNRDVVFRSKSFSEMTVAGCIARWKNDDRRLAVRSLYIHGVQLNIIQRILFVLWKPFHYHAAGNFRSD